MWWTIAQISVRHSPCCGCTAASCAGGLQLWHDFKIWDQCNWSRIEMELILWLCFLCHWCQVACRRPATDLQVCTWHSNYLSTVILSLYTWQWLASCSVLKKGNSTPIHFCAKCLYQYLNTSTDIVIQVDSIKFVPFSRMRSVPNRNFPKTWTWVWVRDGDVTSHFRHISSHSRIDVTLSGFEKVFSVLPKMWRFSWNLLKTWRFRHIVTSFFWV